MRAVETIAEIPEARNDERILVESAIHGGGVNVDLGTVFCEPRDPLRSRDDAEETDVTRVLLSKETNGGHGRASSREHWVEQKDVAIRQVGELPIVWPGHCRFFVPFEADIADGGFREDIEENFQHSHPRAKHWNEDDLGIEVRNFGFLEWRADPVGTAREVARGVESQERRDPLGESPKGLGFTALVAESSHCIFDQGMGHTMQSHDVSSYPFDMRTVDILRRKRSGMELRDEEILFLVEGFTSGEIPRYQISAFLMAVCLQGMSENETLSLTRRMLESGVMLDFADVEAAKIDKHSTGGVGDKTSLVLVPLAASAGLAVPMITGRGLGHTGGTLDKLESIPGFDVRLDRKRFHDVVKVVGCAIVGQTDDIAPADRKLYALRDVTATIDSLPLITGSILSKKLAEGISGLVLDVKAGSGAFMKTVDDAEALARLLLSTAARMERQAVALITNMSQPLGELVGNSLEVEESIAVLKNEGPEDLTELAVLLTAHMLVLGGVAPSLEEADRQTRAELTSGRGLEKFVEMVRAQGGDARVADTAGLPRARLSKPVRAARRGFVNAIDTEAVGTAAMLLGAGRQRIEDTIDPAAGLVVHKKIGNEVREGDPLVTCHYNEDLRLEQAEDVLRRAYDITEAAPLEIQLVHRVVEQERTS